MIQEVLDVCISFVIQTRLKCPFAADFKKRCFECVMVYVTSNGCLLCEMTTCYILVDQENKLRTFGITFTTYQRVTIEIDGTPSWPKSCD